MCVLASFGLKGLEVLTQRFVVPLSILNCPIQQPYPVNPTLMNQLVKYFGPIIQPPRTPTQLKRLIMTESIVRYGRVRAAGGGDRIRTSEGDRLDRDNSFIQVSSVFATSAHVN